MKTSYEQVKQVEAWVWRSLCVLFVAMLGGIVLAPPSLAQLANTKIVFQSDRDGNWEIYVMSADGTNQTRLTTNTVADMDPAWSPDATKIAYNSFRDGSWEIFVMNADGTNQTRLTTNPAEDRAPAWSPDGSKIAFFSTRDGNAEIYVMSVDGTNPTNLTTNPADDRNLSWSLDGTKIAFQSNRDDSNYEIYVMNADGTGTPTRLTTNPAQDWVPAWSPDGTKIAFQSDRANPINGDIYVMNADGAGTPTRLTTNSAEDRDPAWSPDGAKIVFQSSRDGNREIYIMNADGTNPTRLTSTAAQEWVPAWSPFLLLPPTITCPPNVIVNNVADQCSAPVAFNVTATGTPEPTIECKIGSTVITSPHTFDVGTTTVSCTATNSAGSASCSFTVTVVDNQKPTIAVTLDPPTLWPPNNKMRPIAATVTVGDNCPGASYVLTSITCSEPSTGDIQGAVFGTPDNAFDLRAKRLGTGNGRVYTVTYTATDASGNSAIASATVTVPHDMGAGNSRFYDAPIPDRVVLGENYPNPFNPTTMIAYDIPSPGHVMLKVYNLLGQEVAVLVDEDLPAGRYQVSWNASGLASGLYFYRIQAGSFVDTKKLLILK